MYPQDAIELSLKSRIVIEDDYLYHFYFCHSSQTFGKKLEILDILPVFILYFVQYAKRQSLHF